MQICSRRARAGSQAVRAPQGETCLIAVGRLPIVGESLAAGISKLLAEYFENRMVQNLGRPMLQESEVAWVG